ncbi:hypothetical protein O988_06092, partial [Pseudogymnoascus sp. VKM F-3808]
LVELPLAVVGVAEALAEDVEAEDLGQDSCGTATSGRRTGAWAARTQGRIVEAPPVAALEVKAKDASEVEEEVVACCCCPEDQRLGGEREAEVHHGLLELPLLYGPLALCRGPGSWPTPDTWQTASEQDAHDTPPEAGIRLYSLLHLELGEGRVVARLHGRQTQPLADPVGCGVEGQLAPGEVGVHSSNDALQDSLQLGVKLDPKQAAIVVRGALNDACPRVAAGGGLEQGCVGHLPEVEVPEALALASPCNKGVQVVL